MLIMASPVKDGKVVQAGYRKRNADLGFVKEKGVGPFFILQWRWYNHTSEINERESSMSILGSENLSHGFGDRAIFEDVLPFAKGRAYRSLSGPMVKGIDLHEHCDWQMQPDVWKWVV